MFLYQQRYEEQDDGLAAPATLAQVLQRPFMQIEVYTAAVQFQIEYLQPLCEQVFVSTLSLIRSRGGFFCRPRSGREASLYGPESEGDALHASSHWGLPERRWSESMQRQDVLGGQSGTEGSHGGHLR